MNKKNNSKIYKILNKKLNKLMMIIIIYNNKKFHLKNNQKNARIKDNKNKEKYKIVKMNWIILKINLKNAMIKNNN